MNNISTETMNKEYENLLRDHNLSRIELVSKNTIMDIAGIVEHFTFPKPTRTLDYCMSIVLKTPGSDLNTTIRLFYSNMTRFPQNLSIGCVFVSVKVKAMEKWGNKYQAFGTAYSNFLVYKESDTTLDHQYQFYRKVVKYLFEWNRNNTINSVHNFSRNETKTHAYININSAMNKNWIQITPEQNVNIINETKPLSSIIYTNHETKTLSGNSHTNNEINPPSNNTFTKNIVNAEYNKLEYYPSNKFIIAGILDSFDKYTQDPGFCCLFLKLVRFAILNHILIKPWQPNQNEGDGGVFSHIDIYRNFSSLIEQIEGSNTFRKVELENVDDKDNETITCILQGTEKDINKFIENLSLNCYLSLKNFEIVKIPFVKQKYAMQTTCFSENKSPNITILKKSDMLYPLVSSFTPTNDPSSNKSFKSISIYTDSKYDFVCYAKIKEMLESKQSVSIFRLTAFLERIYPEEKESSIKLCCEECGYMQNISFCRSRDLDIQKCIKCGFNLSYNFTMVLWLNDGYDLIPVQVQSPEFENLVGNRNKISNKTEALDIVDKVYDRFENLQLFSLYNQQKNSSTSY
ncbi:hypothetical protein BB558_005167 [Smittium angustum]|uniref:Telomeric single stranded DNA binding POT1/Cdc13 domain-containing protein n=1 Tax=Smittium angustum TaxID=133377 RepID=A0A2U1IYA5_SMIAN|nr:hypothetical protein BB558_006225 [Smittium angustum]PVZ98831.1 hypothetical protein BB558_005167 [Smittium angustum]